MMVQKIHIYWNNNLNNHLHYHSSIGSIIIQNDKWLEGFLLDANYSVVDAIRDTGFIFGVFINNKILELFYCHNDCTMRFQVKSEDDIYVGKCYSIGPYTEYLSGDCNIQILGDTSYDEIQIKNRIQLAKNHISHNSLEYYDTIYRNRYKLIAYEGIQNRTLQKMSDIGINMSLPAYQKKYVKKYSSDNGIISKNNYDNYG